MISVEEAKAILNNNVNSLTSKYKRVSKSLGYIVAEDIYSPVDLPLFDQSAMDGFAICIDEKSLAQKELSLSIVGEIKAGDLPVSQMKEGTAYQIFTGAAAPKNTFAVVVQEKTTVQNNEVSFSTHLLKKGANIRCQGSQIKQGSLALAEKTQLSPAALGFLSSLGLKKVKVYKKPKISILTTGNELQKAGTVLKTGQIYESNSNTLSAALQEAGFQAINVKTVRDEKLLLLKKLSKIFKKSDVLLISGGISVGKYDLVKDVLSEIGVQELFYKVAQKPGKPLFVGKLNEKIVFALPGNPAAVLVCFYEYVLPLLRKTSGFSNAQLKQLSLPLAADFEVKGDKALFQQAKISNQMVTLLNAPDSSMLKVFAEANAIVYLPAGERKIKKGTLVEVHLLSANLP